MVEFVTETKGFITENVYMEAVNMVSKNWDSVIKLVKQIIVNENWDTCKKLDGNVAFLHIFFLIVRNSKYCLLFWNFFDHPQ